MGGIRLRSAFLCVLVSLLLGCEGAAGGPRETPTALPEIRYRDALPLMLKAQDLGTGYEMSETHRLPEGKGWGEDTTRLSGYRFVFRGNGGTFTEVTCQVECYLTIEEAQEAYRAFRQEIAAELRDSTAWEDVHDAEERLLGEWNHMYAAQSKDAMLVRYVFLRNNAFAYLSFTGPQAPTLADEAAQQARSLDDRIFRH